MKIKTILLALSMWCTIASQAQILDVSKHADCSNLLNIEAKGTIGPTTAPQGFGSSLEFKDNSLGDQQFIEKEHHSVWYKFKAIATADLTFQLEPLDKANDYDFALYENTGEGFCQAVMNKELKPIRTNFSRNKTEIDSWTGLSFEAKNKLEPAGVHPAFSKALSVQNGQEYVLLVDNVYPDGKGHLLHFDYLKSLNFKGQVRDITSKKPLSASLKLSNSKTNKNIAQFKVDNSGAFVIDFSMNLEQTKEPLVLELKHPDYPTFTKKLDASFVLSLKGKPLLCELGVLPPPVVEEQVKKNERVFELNGEVIVQNTGEVVEADVIVSDVKSGKILGKTTSDSTTGKYSLKIKTDLYSPIHLEVSKDGYFFQDTILLPYKIKSDIKNIKLDYQIKKLRKGDKFVVGNIIFHGDLPKPLDNSMPTIKALYKTMKINKMLKIRISGHTNGCNKGKDFSDNLSLARTKTILDFLVKNGIKANRIKIQGYGCQRMLYGISSRLNYLNRRVEIDILEF